MFPGPCYQAAAVVVFLHTFDYIPFSTSHNYFAKFFVKAQQREISSRSDFVNTALDCPGKRILLLNFFFLLFFQMTPKLLLLLWENFNNYNDEMFLGH